MESPRTHFSVVLDRLRQEPKVWLITGVAGFIGSNLLESLLSLDQQVIGLDNFSTGRPANLAEVQRSVSARAWSRFQFIEGDIRQLATCQRAVKDVNYVLHQAALGSVPRSIDNPLATHENNVDGFLNMLIAARDQKVDRFVFASSSSVYGDNRDMPKTEDRIGNPLSPYAVSKVVNELYARVFSQTYDIKTVGLRYFNVFGPRQNPNGPYAAVIPKWVAALCKGESQIIYGDGELSRDFCYIKNVLQMNILAATTANSAAFGRVFNTALNARTSINDLHRAVKTRFQALVPNALVKPPTLMPPRQGEIEHSQANISAAREILDYQPQYDVLSGLDECLGWYVGQHLVAPTQTHEIGLDTGAVSV